MRSSLYGGICPGIQWLVNYQGGAGTGGSLAPAADTPTWTRTLTGTGVEAVTACVLSTDIDGAGSLVYNLAESIATDAGALLEAFVTVRGTMSTAGTGLRLVLQTATQAYVAWLRPGGLNLDGLANVALDLTGGFHQVRLLGRGASAALVVAGAVVQTGAPGVVASSLLGFGIPAQTGVIGADWTCVRARLLTPDEVF